MKENHSNHVFIESLMDSFMYQHVDFHTRFRQGQHSSLLDLVFSNEENLITNMTQHAPIGKSDHVLLTFNIDCYSENCESDNRQVFKYNKGNYEGMNQDLSSINWDDVLSDKNVNDNVDFFQ